MPDHMQIEQLAFSVASRGVGEEASLREGSLTVKVSKFKAGDEIPFHRHTDPKHEKLIVKGKVRFVDDDGSEAVMGAGTLYMCGSGALYYYGQILEDTVILVVESSDSKIELRDGV